VCVGLQVLFEHSREGDTDCLGWLPGEVVEFRRSELRVPHMGWNAVRRTSSHPFAAALPPEAHFYFVNSYHAVPAEESDVAGVTEYGPEFASVVARGNVMATQFHIEKSGPVGLALLSRFAELSADELRAQTVQAC
jgi:glutamine amidotransferase